MAFLYHSQHLAPKLQEIERANLMTIRPIRPKHLTVSNVQVDLTAYHGSRCEELTETVDSDFDSHSD